jgi:hypothetical protein
MGQGGARAGKGWAAPARAGADGRRGETGADGCRGQEDQRDGHRVKMKEFVKKESEDRRITGARGPDVHK